MTTEFAVLVFCFLAMLMNLGLLLIDRLVGPEDKRHAFQNWIIYLLAVIPCFAPIIFVFLVYPITKDLIETADRLNRDFDAEIKRENKT
ncbi:MAG: hypothetical protein V1821_04545 [bacterium]